MTPADDQPFRLRVKPSALTVPRRCRRSTHVQRERDLRTRWLYEQSIWLAFRTTYARHRQLPRCRATSSPSERSGVSQVHKMSPENFSNFCAPKPFYVMSNINGETIQDADHVALVGVPIVVPPTDTISQLEGGDVLVKSFTFSTGKNEHTLISGGK